jgi:hypothetical protein
MGKLILFYIAIIYLFNFVFASDVIVLTDDNFHDRIANEPIALVKFFAPW